MDCGTLSKLSHTSGKLQHFLIYTGYDLWSNRICREQKVNALNKFLLVLILYSK